jgi:hypothetical protein
MKKYEKGIEKKRSGLEPDGKVSQQVKEGGKGGGWVSKEVRYNNDDALA